MSDHLHSDEVSRILASAAPTWERAVRDQAALSSDDEQSIEILPDGTIVGGGVPAILTKRADLGSDY